MKLNIELYLKVDFLGTGVGLEKFYNGNGKRNRYGYSRLLVVLQLFFTIFTLNHYTISSYVVTLKHAKNRTSNT